jgi:hypothetical protein
MLIRRQIFRDDSRRVDWIVCFRCIFPSVFLLSGNSGKKENKNDGLAAGVFRKEFRDIVRLAMNNHLDD